jgi:hypothetical protein
MSALTHVGRFTSREQAEAARAGFQKAHADMGPLAPVESPEYVGEYTLRVVSAEALGEAPAVDQRQKFALIPAAKFLKRPRPRWLIKGVLPEAQLAAVVGQPGAGKSPFMYSMAAAIHRGADWYGRRVRKGRAVYLVAEGAADFRNRIEAYAREFGVDVSELPPMIDDVPNLKTPADAAAIAHKVGKADAIFIDTFAASFIGDENSGEHIGPVLAHLKFISAKTGALCVLACHPGKDASKGLRGWSGTLGALDTEITITRQGDYRSADVTKQKSGPEGPLFNFNIKVHELGRDEDGDPVTSVTVEPCNVPVNKSSREKTRGGMYVDAIKNFARASGKSEFDVQELVGNVVPTLPKTGPKDRRPFNVERAVMTLTADFFEVVPDTDGERVRVRGIVEDNAPEAWLS